MRKAKWKLPEDVQEIVSALSSFMGEVSEPCEHDVSPDVRLRIAAARCGARLDALVNEVYNRGKETKK